MQSVAFAVSYVRLTFVLIMQNAKNEIAKVDSPIKT